MGYKNLIQTVITEMDDILLREINELCPIDKQPILVHKVQYDHDALTSIRLVMQSDMRYRRTRPKISMSDTKSKTKQKRNQRRKEAASIPQVNLYL